MEGLGSLSRRRFGFSVRLAKNQPGAGPLPPIPHDQPGDLRIFVLSDLQDGNLALVPEWTILTFGVPAACAAFFIAALLLRLIFVRAKKDAAERWNWCLLAVFSTCLLASASCALAFSSFHADVTVSPVLQPSWEKMSKLGMDLNDCKLQTGHLHYNPDWKPSGDSQYRRPSPTVINREFWPHFSDLRYTGQVDCITLGLGLGAPVLLLLFLLLLAVCSIFERVC